MAILLDVSVNNVNFISEHFSVSSTGDDPFTNFNFFNCGNTDPFHCWVYSGNLS